MEFTKLYTRLEQSKYYVFSFEDLLAFFPDENKANLKRMILRWKEKKLLYPLKKGLYELIYPRDFNIPDTYIANRLYEPSYISLETALSHYSIIPEVSMAAVSLTTKPTRTFRNKHGLFTYHTVHPGTFTGYFIERQDGFDVRMAEPEKALVDFLYFKRYRNKKFDISRERLDKDALAKLDRAKLNRYAKLFSLDLKELYAYA